MGRNSSINDANSATKVANKLPFQHIFKISVSNIFSTQISMQMSDKLETDDQHQSLPIPIRADNATRRSTTGGLICRRGRGPAKFTILSPIKSVKLLKRKVVGVQNQRGSPERNERKKERCVCDELRVV